MPTITPATTPTPTATPVETFPDLTVRLFNDLDMVVGQKARLEDTSIEITLIEASLPPPDEYDAPNTAAILVSSGEEMQELWYSFSGNMQWETLQKAVRKTAFGFAFVVVRIAEGGLTIRVEPDQG